MTKVETHVLSRSAAGSRTAHRNRANLRRRARVVAVAAAAAGCVTTATQGVALAAAPPPQSTVLCAGVLHADPKPTTDDPFLTDYRFSCSGDISAYTLIVNRRLEDTDTIDDFSATADILDPTETAVVPTINWSCSGTVPGAGINCNAGGGVMGAGYYANGSIDLTDAFCRHFAAKARPGDDAIPEAYVQLVATEASGAQDGPFKLTYKSACPPVPARMPSRKAKPRRTKHPNSRAHDVRFGRL